MNTNKFVTTLGVVAVLNLTTGPRAASCTNNTTLLPVLAVQAVSPDAAEAQRAITKLRDSGPAGLQALVNSHQEQIQTHGGHNRSLLLQTSPPDDAAWDRLRAALDAVGRQRDCHASQLYWYTDLEQAKAAGKPILSLRLLGRLDEEFSCANSRFFRTTLYANRDVAHFLRANFVLHWRTAWSADSLVRMFPKTGHSPIIFTRTRFRRRPSNSP